MSDSPDHQPATRERDERGRLLKGHSLRGGRPPGSIDLLRLAKKRAKREGRDVFQAVYEALLALMDAAKSGDVRAAEVLLRHLATPLEKHSVAIQLEQNLALSQQVQAGPPVPSGADLGAYLARLTELGSQLLAGQPAQLGPAEREVLEAATEAHPEPLDLSALPRIPQREPAHVELPEAIAAGRPVRYSRAGVARWIPAGD